MKRDELLRLMACSLFFAGVGWSVAHDYSWKDRDISEAYKCGIATEARKAAGLGKMEPEHQELCDRYRHAGWTSLTYSVQRCFDLYNDRPLDQSGYLPFDLKAKVASDACFAGLSR